MRILFTATTLLFFTFRLSTLLAQDYNTLVGGVTTPLYKSQKL